MRKIISLIFLILIGCGIRSSSTYYYIHSPEAVSLKKVIKIYVDHDFGNGDKSEILKGIDQWNFAMNGQIKLEVVDWNFMKQPSLLVDGEKWFIMKIDSRSKFKPADTSEAFTLAFCERIGGHLMYIIRDRIGNSDVKGITMHELGHLLGSDHVGKYLMYYRFQHSRYNCVDYASAESVARAQGLDMGSMNYCIYESGI